MKMMKMMITRTAFQFPRQIVVLWAAVCLFRVLTTSGILIYIIKYFDVEKHFFTVILVDSIVCLLMSLAGFVNFIFMTSGFYNLMSCYFNFFFIYNILLVGAVVTALISVFR